MVLFFSGDLCPDSKTCCVAPLFWRRFFHVSRLGKTSGRSHSDHKFMKSPDSFITGALQNAEGAASVMLSA